MRLIKFRAWDDYAECWDYYSLDDLIAGKSVKTKYKIKNEFTGLLDKRGKKVFEGDIVKALSEYDDKPRIAVIEWHRDIPTYLVARYLKKQEGLGDYNFNPPHILQLEVIGNIYENKDLLKEKNGKSKS